MIDISSTTLPFGTLACDGSAYSTAAYPSLFAAIQYTYGGSGGSFNVPNCQRKTLVGSGGTGTSELGSTVGSSGGEESHLLLAAESGMPSHYHTITDPSHGHSLSNSVSGNTGNTNDNTANVTAVNRYGLIENIVANNNYTGITVNYAAAENASSYHNNIQPSLVVTKAIAYI